MADRLAFVTGSLFNLCQFTAGHIPETGFFQMVFDPIDQVREQSKLKVSRPFQLFLRQVPLTAQAEILAIKPPGGLHHRNAMIGVILLLSAANQSSFRDPFLSRPSLISA